MIDFLILWLWELQFSSLVLKQTDHTPVLPQSVCLLYYSHTVSLFCFFLLLRPHPPAVVFINALSSSAAISTSFHTRLSASPPLCSFSVLLSPSVFPLLRVFLMKPGGHSGLMTM